MPQTEDPAMAGSSAFCLTASNIVAGIKRMGGLLGFLRFLTQPVEECLHRQQR